ncbi:glycosyltransferase family 39 protein [Conexibacter sp. JD483]|uniref:ArnT family glycosyltransferase n=1 Tax=unclassified Conexibacter TaxID=2627773 RepID=UPI002718021E|nr:MULTISPECIES: glycosyltransferase family 39 protein [unclassified Conexibacter]MDO8186861.1 glycosyltransferase family 39 protein [Conexibacter sp. CPCC 205706]MDO8200827.1 glycosyltransferase family 39 protein [Conexibacter sp. CPCC 205762]MDR9369963.1 glycosyltransferase family 39 protein [Conexibacter sp. JD483]
MRPNPAKLEHAGAAAGSVGGRGAPAGAAPADAARPSARDRGLALLDALRRRPELLGLLALAAVLYLWALSRNGWANDYYSAAVRSMSTSWHDFLYGSFDSSGLMTVDKPPMALWVEALSVRLFGYSSLPILVPQALMGMASAALTYDLVRRSFGRVAGFVGGLALVLTPVTVAISRHNNPDALLVLCSVAAIWFLVRGLQDGRTKWIVLSGVAVGLGFETKMGAALLVVPGIALAWMWIAPRGRGLLDAARQLTLGGIALAVVGLAWPVLVWLTPAADRPWVGGSTDNSIWSLIMDYNGLGRLDGQAGGPGGGAGGGPGGGGGGAGSVFGGDSGPLRLLGSSLGGQVGWILGVAVVGGLGLLVATRLKRSDARSGWLIAVGGAFATSAVAFSFAQGIFHPYYVSALAPFAAALVGAAAGLVLEGGVRGRIVGAAAVAGGAITTLAVLHSSGDMGWLAPLVGVGATATLVALALPGVTTRIRNAVLAAMLALLLFAPASWSFQTLGHATSSTFPAGGPASAGMGGGPGGGPGGRGGPPGMSQQGGGGFGGPPGMTQQGSTGTTQSGTTQSGQAGGMGGPGGGAGGMFGGEDLTEALAYVKSHGGGTIAIASQSGASASIIQSGASVAGIGGFSGRESTVSIDWLANAVASGKVRWVISSDSTSGGFGGGGIGNDGRAGSETALTAAARVGTQTSVSGLYDLQGKAAALKALGS